MKKIFMIMAAFVLSMTAMAQNVKMGVEVKGKTLSISMDNDFVVYTMGFYMALPEGVTVGTVYDEDEEEDVPAFIKNTNRMKTAHQIDAKIMKDGTYSVNIYGTSFKGETGEVLTINLEGEMKGEVVFSGINFANKAADSFEQDDIKVDLSGTGINTVKAAANNGAIFNLAGQQVSKAQKGIFIQNGKKMIVK